MYTPDTASNSAPTPATASDIASACVLDFDPAPPPASASAPASDSTSAYVSVFAPATASAAPDSGKGNDAGHARPCSYGVKPSSRSIDLRFEDVQWAVAPKSKRAWEKAQLAYEQDRGICNPQPLDEPSEHRVGPGVPLLPNSFEETEWLVPPRDDTARLKARHAYDQWKQEAISLSSHNPHTSSGGRSISHPGRVNGSAAKNWS